MKPLTQGDPTRFRSRSGFTLIEILVVVGIIALLAALILSVFSRARSSARQATCASNLKQIGLGFQLYVSDNRNLHPPFDTVPGCSWAERIYPYAKSAAIFTCPSFSVGEFRPGCPPSEDTTDPVLPTTRWQGSYDRNLFFIAGRKSFSATRVRAPSETILFCDGVGSAHNFGNSPTGVFQAGVPYEPRDLFYLGNRHNGGANVAYIDGHVKWKHYDALLDAKQWQYR